MSSDLLKIIRSLKVHSDHNNHDSHDHHDHDYGNYRDRNSRYDHHYERHGNKHFFPGAICEVVRKLSGKIYQNKQLALAAIITLLTVAALFLVCAVWLVAALIKLCGPLISDMEKNGLKGVVDAVSKIITRIWEGAGK
jgi:hypothetical protein